ncbi:MAG: tetratricopeptide repeat protein, partial [Gammaproteobacteria bacterium]
GYLLMLFALILLPAPRNAYAFGWHDLWQRPDQRAAQAMAAHQPGQAAKLFRDPQWRAAAHYRAGDYRAVLKDLKEQHGAEAAYNRGNALAHLGQYQQALNAYEDALKLDPDFEDAAYNRDLVKKWLQPPPQNKKQSGGKGQQQPQKSQGGSRSPNGKPQDQQQAGRKGGGPQDKGQPANSSPGKDQDASRAKAQRKAGNNSTASPKRQQAGKQSSGQQQGAAAKDTQTGQQARQGDQQQRTARNDKQMPNLGDAKPAKSESQQATEQWLRRIPDDPGGLWRRKFLYQYKHEYQSQRGEAKPW